MSGRPLWATPRSARGRTGRRPSPGRRLPGRGIAPSQRLRLTPAPCGGQRCRSCRAMFRPLPRPALPAARPAETTRVPAQTSGIRQRRRPESIPAMVTRRPARLSGNAPANDDRRHEGQASEHGNERGRCGPGASTGKHAGIAHEAVRRENHAACRWAATSPTTRRPESARRGGTRSAAPRQPSEKRQRLTSSIRSNSPTIACPTPPGRRPGSRLPRRAAWLGCSSGLRRRWCATSKAASEPTTSTRKIRTATSVPITPLSIGYVIPSRASKSVQLRGWRPFPGRPG